MIDLYNAADAPVACRSLRTQTMQCLKKRKGEGKGDWPALSRMLARYAMRASYVQGG